MQLVQETEPVADSVDVPGAHASQEVALEMAEKLPELQGTQNVRSEVLLKVPGGQISQPFISLVRPLPGGQLRWRGGVEGGEEEGLEEAMAMSAEGTRKTYVPHMRWSSEAG